MNGLIIRPYRAEDAAPLARVFHRAVRKGATRHYTLPQRLAWSPRVLSAENWHLRLSKVETVVAELPQGLVGFMALDPEVGFVDFAYVAPEVQGRGVAGALYAVLEGRARRAGIDRLETEASRVAEPFFARRGWRIVSRQKVLRHGVPLPNALMAKPLGGRPQAGVSA